MCFSGGNKSNPAPPPPPPAPPRVPNRKADRDQTQAARTDEKQRAALSVGQKNTVLTGPLGDTTQANVKKKTLLGE